MRLTHSFTISILFLAATTCRAATNFVDFDKGDFQLNQNNRTIIGIADNEQRGVHRAAQNLCTDLKAVCGAEVIIGQESSATIVAGTLGSSKIIDEMAKNRIFDAKMLKGKTEMFLITATDKQLIIAGSDRRGTIYGIYEVSRQLGVSPWYYWADVPIQHHPSIFIKKGTYTDGEPAVRYRGIFLNDEAPCLTSWVKNTFETNYGDHRFYEKVFELILRLKGNFMWPAMWGWAFYADDPENLKTADEMGIMMGTSHHEPMARNHQEYARNRKGWGAWNYNTNQQNLDRFFREGIERIKGTDDVVTIGMRGDGDEAMGEEADTKLMERIVKNQRQIIADVTKRPAKETPQVWALYKEVLDYYDKGMKVPDDVLILLCDDNWGNVRRVPNAQERKHKGGWGLYYHVDYVGAPRNSKWLNVTPSQNMWEQLSLAYNNGIDRMWILNVGDLKPMEYPIQLFMDMAWKPGSVSHDVVGTHTTAFCIETFGEKQGPEAARLLNHISKINGRSTAEMLDAGTYALDEWPRVISEYQSLEIAALEQFSSISSEYHDAYRQIILFPVQAMSNLHQMYYAHAMNQKLYKEQNPECNRWADEVIRCFKKDSTLCAYYNQEMSGGKWNGMMTQKHIGYRSWNDDFAKADVMPAVNRIKEQEGGNVFTEKDGYVAIEAEHYYQKDEADGSPLLVIPGMGRTLSGVRIDGGSLLYKWETTGDCQQATVYVIVKSTLDYLNKGGLEYEVSVDGGTPQIINFNSNLNEKPENIYSIYYPTVARRVVESKVRFPMAKGIHTLKFAPKDPNIILEKIVIDLGGYHQQYLYGEESPRKFE
ncbi:MAG: glycosyl hydrolase 115 family protein [Prevotella sp.]|nr:glycosyl hydrolase 115 family protein [Prevotella sp.]